MTRSITNDVEGTGGVAPQCRYTPSLLDATSTDDEPNLHVA
jgi:hypothetical protein